MRTLAAVIVSSSLAGGCVIYEEELLREDEDVGRPAGGADNEDDAEASLTLWLEPGGAVKGDVVIVSLHGEGEVDLSTVTDIRFFGDTSIEILATQTRDADEYLLTVDVPEGSPAGAADILVEFADGTAAYVEAAFEVVDDSSQIPTSDGHPSDEDGC
jgi:hypothetical protein